jgi:hypothetical protein
MFQSEDEFQAFFISHFGVTYLGQWIYAKITRIAGEFIQPEIDLLDITPILPNQTLKAFEFKFLITIVFMQELVKHFRISSMALTRVISLLESRKKFN